MQSDTNTASTPTNPLDTARSWLKQNVKRDAEKVMVGSTNSKAAGDHSTVPRQMGAFINYMTGNQHQHDNKSINRIS